MHPSSAICDVCCTITSGVATVANLSLLYLLLLQQQEEHEEMHRKESEAHDPLLPGLDSSKRRYSQWEDGGMDWTCQLPDIL